MSFLTIFFSDYVALTFYFKGSMATFPFSPVISIQAADDSGGQTSVMEHESVRVLSVIGCLCLSGSMRSSLTGGGLKSGNAPFQFLVGILLIYKLSTRLYRTCKHLEIYFDNQSVKIHF